MERAKVQEIVERHAGPLIEELGLEHWTIGFRYDLRSSTGGYASLGQCNRQVKYSKASISFDPDELDSEEDVLRILRHELFHLVVSPFDLPWLASDEANKADPVKLAIVDTVWDHAQEQAVFNLERMYSRMTARKP